MLLLYVVIVVIIIKVSVGIIGNKEQTKKEQTKKEQTKKEQLIIPKYRPWDNGIEILNR
tara:strand:+ start:859 stop:1035 length:177 start_codon:yes stop_codon:yes gene_type:complete